MNEVARRRVGFVAGVAFCFTAIVPIRAVAATSAVTDASPADAESLALVRTTPQLCRKRRWEWLPRSSQEYWGACGAHDGGYVGEAYAGTLDDGRRAIVIPLASGGTAGFWEYLLYVSDGRKTHFVGTIPSGSHSRIVFSRGHLLVLIPKDGPACCADHFEVLSYDLRGIRLRHLASYVYAAGPWEVVQPYDVWHRVTPAHARRFDRWDPERQAFVPKDEPDSTSSFEALRP